VPWRHAPLPYSTPAKLKPPATQAVIQACGVFLSPSLGLDPVRTRAVELSTTPVQRMGKIVQPRTAVETPWVGRARTETYSPWTANPTATQRMRWARVGRAASDHRCHRPAMDRPSRAWPGKPSQRRWCQCCRQRGATSRSSILPSRKHERQTQVRSARQDAAVKR